MINKLLIILCGLILTTSSVYAENFISGFDTIPLMKDLNETDDQTGLNFDTVDFKVIERIVESNKVSETSFRSFYIPTLKSLGWTQTNNTKKMVNFERGTEKLSIEIIHTNEPFIARFLLHSE